MSELPKITADELGKYVTMSASSTIFRCLSQIADATDYLEANGYQCSINLAHRSGHQVRYLSPPGADNNPHVRFTIEPLFDENS